MKNAGTGAAPAAQAAPAAPKPLDSRTSKPASGRAASFAEPPPSKENVKEVSEKELRRMLHVASA